MTNSPSRKATGGFSLIEVSLALMLVGGAALGLLSLFPRGLEQAELALNDSNGAMFAREIFAEVRADAADLTWANWPGGLGSDMAETIKYPDPSGKRSIYYELSFVDVWDYETGLQIPELVGVQLVVQPAEGSKTKWRYYTEICYGATSP